VFAYPADDKHVNGKLRLMFEANPLAMIVEEAGGASSTGKQSILEVKPMEVHQKVPVFLGSKSDIKLIEKLLK